MIVVLFRSRLSEEAGEEHPEHRRAQARGEGEVLPGGAPLPRPVSAPRYCAVSRISGSPSLPAPMITTLAFADMAIFSVASIPFQRRS